MPIEERRLEPRVNFKTSLRYQVRGRPIFDNAISDNISAGGVGFLTDKFVAPSTLVELEINILNRVVRFIGEVVSSAPVSHSYRNRLGVRLMEIQPPDKNFLSDFIKMRLGEI